MTSSQKKKSAVRSIRNYSLAGLSVVFVLLLGAGGWAVTAQLSGAVVGSGTVVVDGNVKQVQHREGGVVGEIFVRNGTRVNAGDLLVKLDDTVTRAGLAIVTNQIDQLSARRARLVAERDDVLSMSLASNNDDLSDNEYLAAEEVLFSARRKTLDGQKEQLRQRVEQIGQETTGLTVRRSAKEEELSWLNQELTRTRSLSDKQLVQFNRLAELERLRAQLDGERGQLITEIARASTRVTETELQILQLDQERRAEVLTELRDVDNKLAELAQQRITAQDELKRIEIFAPQTGIVHELTVHTIGGVIAAGETIMQVVPVDDVLVIEARIQPADIDQLHIGQQATLRLSAFNQRTTPEITGNIQSIAADLIQNPQTGEAWYSTRIHIPEAELQRLSGLTLLPGMPVEAYIKTGERSAMSYLIKPLFDQINRAMRED
jgi:HlyD family secretion protein